MFQNNLTLPNSGLVQHVHHYLNKLQITSPYHTSAKNLISEVQNCVRNGENPTNWNMDGNYTFNAHFLTASITSHLTSSYPATYLLTLAQYDIKCLCTTMAE